jgi:hypothetical protein
MLATTRAVILLGLVLLGSVIGAQTRLTTPKEDQTLLRAVYQELVEINTTDSVGDTTKAAQAMAARLRTAGYADKDLQILYPAGASKKGNLGARLHGTGAQRPLLLPPISTSSRPDGRTGPAIHSSWSRKTTSSTGAAPPTTSRWPRYSSRKWSG